MNNMRTMRVTGKGQIRVKPDMTRITIILEGSSREYAKTLRRSSEETEQLKEILSTFGFKRSDLKTLNFEVEPEYESVRERDSSKRVFVGYRFEHRMKIEFESDNERLGKILYALANCPLNPEFRISYTVKDPEATKNELLGKAVTDAIGKAKVLSAAACVMLGEIQSIDYSWGKIDFEVQPMERMMMYEASIDESASYSLDFEPDDIDVSDTVTVVWEIC